MQSLHTSATALGALAVTTFIFYVTLRKAADGMYSTFSYILQGSFGEDFCSLPYSPGRLIFDDGSYISSPYEICGSVCKELDDFLCVITTLNKTELIVSEKMSREERANITRRHSSSVTKGVLSRETALKLRKVMYENSERDRASSDKPDEVDVIAPERRWHGMPSLDEPLVRRTLHEIGEHPIMRPLMEDILSPRASLVSFSVIRVDYGAKDQDWHSDAGLLKTPFGYENPYAFDTYSLAIPLQDINSKMGPTQLCPGVLEIDTDEDEHGIAGQRECYAECDNCDKVASLPDHKTYVKGRMNDICLMLAPLEAGDGYLFKGDVWHRGTAHIDPKAQDRFMLFAIFNESPKGSDDKRTIQGSGDSRMVYAQKLEYWGLDISTLKWLDVPFGLWKLSHAAILALAYIKRIGSALKWWTTDAYMPLTYIDAFCLLIFKESSSESLGHYPEEGYRGVYKSDIEKWVQSFKKSRNAINIIISVGALAAAVVCFGLWLLYTTGLLTNEIFVKPKREAKRNNKKKSKSNGLKIKNKGVKARSVFGTQSKESENQHEPVSRVDSRGRSEPSLAKTNHAHVQVQTNVQSEAETETELKPEDKFYYDTESESSENGEYVNQHRR